MSIAIWAVLAIPGIAYWFIYLVAFASGAPGEKSATFGAGDMVAGVLLGAYLAMNIFAGSQKTPAVTREMIVQSCVFYSLIVIMLLSLLIVRNRNPIELFGLRWPGWKKELPLAVLALLAIYPILSLIQEGIQSFVSEKDATQEILLFLIGRPLWRTNCWFRSWPLCFRPLPRS